MICGTFGKENLSDFLEEVPLLDRNKIVFQNGTGSHNTRIVTNYLNEFPECWTGRYGPIL